LNREFKRRMKRDQRAQERAQVRGPARPPVPVQRERRERVKFRQYIGEIRSELKRVIWPTRSEVVTYSIVVVMVVTVLTMLVFVLDIGFAKGVLEIFRPARP
jgi:preprotein translocase subunit SecE